LIHPYDDWDVIHGAGTTGLEITEDVRSPGALVVPIGGGGQISGIALAIAGLSPESALIGVEPEAADDAAQSLRTGILQTLPSDPETLAEGVKSKSVGERNFGVIVGDALVREIVTVSEDDLTDALRVAWMRLKLAIEPTGALALAAYITGRVPAGTTEHPTVIVLSGGNSIPPPWPRSCPHRRTASYSGIDAAGWYVLMTTPLGRATDSTSVKVRRGTPLKSRLVPSPSTIGWIIIRYSSMRSCRVR